MDLVIRISFQERGFVDWNLPPPYPITFQDVLYAISEASNNEIIVSAFEYTDEDSDRITVKSDSELHAMVQFHVSQMEILAQSGKPFHLPLIIYPKVMKPAQQRNIHGLKLSLNSNPVKKSTHPQQQIQSNENTNFPTKKADVSSKPTLPNTFGDFQFLELLGNGNSGVVYKAVHKRTGTITAIKSIALDLSDDEQGRIKSELAILSRCNGSPHIVAFYGSYFDDSRIFLCMEYMDVGSLEQFNIIPERVLQRICHCVLQGLRYMWSLKIMHRDVKPSNMLVNTLGTVKLCDFGVSTQLVNSIAQTYVGTNAYMSPERVVGNNYSIFSDIWSLGLSVCEMATGTFPYPQLTEKMAGSKGLVPMELMQCIVHDAAPRLSGEKFSPDLVDFIQLCLQKDAGHRPTPDTLCQHKFVHLDPVIRDKDEIIAKWLVEEKPCKSNN